MLIGSKTKGQKLAETQSYLRTDEIVFRLTWPPALLEVLMASMARLKISRQRWTMAVAN